ncbi:hypothetical protein BDQ17DRAFT_1332037 [Cyathus striatus]|nr:hypothetical protein BDQ17DRAFT_1332037 [Cyathus striatus]
MFNSASNFVIQNSVFIGEMKKFCHIYIPDVKKIYQKPPLGTHFTKASGTSNRIYPGNMLQSNFKRIRTGDIDIIESVERSEAGPTVDNVGIDYVVELSGENKRRTARIYRGPSRYDILQMELEILAKLWPHPSIPQVFGIYELIDTVGLVFNDNGISTLL